MTVFSKFKVEPGARYLLSHQREPELITSDNTRGFVKRLLEEPFREHLLDNVTEDMNVLSFIKSVAEDNISLQEDNRAGKVISEIERLCRTCQDHQFFQKPFMEVCREYFSGEATQEYLCLFNLFKFQDLELVSGLNLYQNFKAIIATKYSSALAKKLLAQEGYWAQDKGTIAKKVGLLPGAFVSNQCDRLVCDGKDIVNFSCLLMQKEKGNSDPRIKMAMSNLDKGLDHTLQTHQVPGSCTKDSMTLISRLCKTMRAADEKTKVLFKLPFKFIFQLYQDEIEIEKKTSVSLYQSSFIRSCLHEMAVLLISENAYLFEQVENGPVKGFIRKLRLEKVPFDGTGKEIRDLFAKIVQSINSLKIGKDLSVLRDFFQRYGKDSSFEAVDGDMIKKKIGMDETIILDEYNTLYSVLDHIERKDKHILLECQKDIQSLFEKCKQYVNPTGYGLSDTSIFLQLMMIEVGISALLDDFDGLKLGIERRFFQDDEFNEYISVLEDLKDLKEKKKRTNSPGLSPKTKTKSPPSTKKKDDSRKEVSLSVKPKASQVEKPQKVRRLQDLSSKVVTCQLQSDRDQSDLEFHVKESLRLFQLIFEQVGLGNEEEMFFHCQRLFQSMSVALELNGRQFSDSLVHDLDQTYPKYQEEKLNNFLAQFRFGSLESRYPEAFRFHRAASGEDQSIVSDFLITLLPVWKELTQKKKIQNLDRLANSFECFLQIISDSPDQAGAIKEFSAKAIEKLEQSATKSLVAEALTPDTKFCLELKQKLLMFLNQNPELRFQKGAPFSCLKNIIVTMNVLADGLKGKSTQDLRLNQVLLLPLLERASELVLELMTTLNGEKLRSHSFKEYKTALADILSPPEMQAISFLEEFNFGNHSHYIHRKFGKHHSQVSSNFDVYKEVALLVSDPETLYARVPQDSIQRVSEGFQKGLDCLGVLVNKVLSYQSQSNEVNQCLALNLEALKI